MKRPLWIVRLFVAVVAAGVGVVIFLQTGQAASMLAPCDPTGAALKTAITATSSGQHLDREYLRDPQSRMHRLNGKAAGVFIGLQPPTHKRPPRFRGGRLSR